MRTMPMKWANEHKGEKPCATCGRPLKDKMWFVHVINGGNSVLHPADAKEYETDGGDLGIQLIGPECRKKFGEFAQPY